MSDSQLRAILNDPQSSLTARHTYHLPSSPEPSRGIGDKISSIRESSIMFLLREALPLLFCLTLKCARLPTQQIPVTTRLTHHLFTLFPLVHRSFNSRITSTSEHTRVDRRGSRTTPCCHFSCGACTRAGMRGVCEREANYLLIVW